MVDRVQPSAFVVLDPDAVVACAINARLLACRARRMGRELPRYAAEYEDEARRHHLRARQHMASVQLARGRRMWP